MSFRWMAYLINSERSCRSSFRIRLDLSVKTIDAHKTNLMRKLDLHDRSELIKYAIQRKLIHLPSMKIPLETAS